MTFFSHYQHDLLAGWSLPGVCRRGIMLALWNSQRKWVLLGTICFFWLSNENIVCYPRLNNFTLASVYMFISWFQMKITYCSSRHLSTVWNFCKLTLVQM